MKNKKLSGCVFLAALCAALCLNLSGCGKKAEPAPAATTAAAAEADTAQSAGAGSGAASSAGAGAGAASSAAAESGADSEKTVEELAEESVAESIAASKAAAPWHEKELLANVASGLEARWALNAEKSPEGMSLEEFKKYASAGVRAELDALREPVLYSFEDDNLYTLMSQYRMALNRQLKGISEITDPDGLSQNEAFLEGFFLRVVTIYTFKNTYGLTVSPEYEKNLDEIVGDYEEAKKQLGL